MASKIQIDQVFPPAKFDGLSLTTFRGDYAEYTGETQVLHGAVFHEIRILEGHLQGQLRVTMRAPGSK